MGSWRQWPLITSMLLLFANPAISQEKKTETPASSKVTKPAAKTEKSAAKAKKSAGAPQQEAAEPVTDEAANSQADPPPLIENSLEMCQDGEDNDGDSHVDCDDQDCEIYAICIPVEPAAQPAQPAPPPTPVAIQVPVQFPLTETGLQCRDGVDNNNNGLIDCHDPVCQSSHYCRRVMYERPSSPADKPPGLLVGAALGAALPNYRLPEAKAKWQDPNTGDTYHIPYDPDAGLMIDLQVGYSFIKWMAAGIGFKSALTFASNKELYLLTADDEDNYKYIGSKYYGNVSAFIRLQWPLARIMPYVNIHVGYSVTQHTWHVYDALNTWYEIDEYEIDDSESIIGERDEIRSKRERHFTLAFEPGVDFFVIKRLFGIGVKAWLPAVASKNAASDNVGVLLNFVLTPTWREPIQLKAEYQK